MNVLKILDKPIKGKIHDIYRPKLAGAKAVLADVSAETGADFMKLNARERSLIVAVLEYSMTHDREQVYDLLRSIADEPHFKAMLKEEAAE